MRWRKAKDFAVANRKRPPWKGWYKQKPTE